MAGGRAGEEKKNRKYKKKNKGVGIIIIIIITQYRRQYNIIYYNTRYNTIHTAEKGGAAATNGVRTTAAPRGALLRPTTPGVASLPLVVVGRASPPPGPRSGKAVATTSHSTTTTTTISLLTLHVSFARALSSHRTPYDLHFQNHIILFYNVRVWSVPYFVRRRRSDRVRAHDTIRRSSLSLFLHYIFL